MTLSVFLLIAFDNSLLQSYFLALKLAYSMRS